ncbi:MAG: hypothetical protein KAJ75_01270 [Alphaproteobacteria bacterium]|nr:hypothetical protein [Alphaproteobacteria bacterium]
MKNSYERLTPLEKALDAVGKQKKEERSFIQKRDAFSSKPLSEYTRGIDFLMNFPLPAGTVLH